MVYNTRRYYDGWIDEDKKHRDDGLNYLCYHDSIGGRDGTELVEK